jgi:hypothetical protein
MAGPADDNWWQDSKPVATGEEFLKTLPPARAAQIRALAEGRMELPKGFSLRTPYAQQLLADAAQYDPSFDAANLPARTATRKAFTSGTQSKNVTSFNTALGHLQSMAQSVEALHNGSVPLFNAVGNAIRPQFGDTHTAAALTQFKIDRQAVVEELTRAFKGGQPDVHGVKGWESILNPNASPEALRAGISEAARLLQSRVDSMHESYNQGMGTTDQPLPMLTPHALDALSTLQGDDYQKHGTFAPAGAPPVVPLAGGAPPPPPAGPTGGSPSAPPAPSGAPGAHLDGSTDIGYIRPDAIPGAPDTPGSTAIDHDATVERFSTDRDRQVQAQLQDAYNKGASREQLLAIAGPYRLGPEIDLALSERAKGRRGATFGLPQSGSRPIGEFERTMGKLSDTTAGALATGAANSVTFGTAPKLVSLADTVGQQLRGDQRGFGENYRENLDSTERNFGILQQEHPVATIAGNALGYLGGEGIVKVGAKGLLKLAPQAGTIVSGLADVNNVSRGALAYRAATPALTDATVGGLTGLGSSDSLDEIPGNVIDGAALAALGGTIGRGGVKAVAGVASPLASAGVRRLTDAGVTLTPGQILGANGGLFGRAAKGIEDRLTGFPLIGDAINTTRRGGIEDFNRAALTDALAPIGGTPAGVGHDGIAAARQQVSDAYTNALGQMRAVPDTQGLGEISSVGQRVAGMAPDQQSAFEDIMQNDVRPYLRTNGGQQIDSEGLQSIKQGLDREIARRGPNASPQDQALGDRLREMRDAFMSMAARTDPQGARAFAQADAAHALLSRVEGAAAKSKDGVFTPNQFRQAVTKRGYGTTTRNVADGTAPMQQLATDASTILPSTVPDSGTAGRQALGAVLGQLAAPAAGGTVGAGAGYLSGDSGGATAGALLGGALFSRPGAKVLQYGLAGSRGKVANTLGEWLRNNAQLGGAVVAPALLPGVTYDGP